MLSCGFDFVFPTVHHLVSDFPLFFKNVRPYFLYKDSGPGGTDKLVRGTFRSFQMKKISSLWVRLQGSFLIFLWIF